jgi:N-acetylneuraminic acid mutarotase
LNNPRQELAVAAIDGFLVAVGGLAGRANANEVYDVENDVWYFGADLPVSTDHNWAVTLNGVVYAGGGSAGNRVFSYDVYADAWKEVASSNYVHGGTPAAAVIDGWIYLAGGTGGGNNRLEVYVPEENTWYELARMNHPREHTTGGAINGKLYVAGGRGGPAGFTQNFLEEYDPATDTWTDKTSMPTGRSGIGGAVVGGCLYVFGGEGNSADAMGIFHQVEAYEPATNTWTRLPPMRTGRHGIYTAVIDNMIFLPGGATRAGFGVTGTNEVLVIDIE